MNTLYVILCVAGLRCEVVDQSIIGGNFVKGPSGTVYVAGFGPHEEIPNSATHTNIIVAELTPELADQLPNLGKSVAISGIADPQAFMQAFGLVRCNEDGSPIQEDQL